MCKGRAQRFSEAGEPSSVGSAGSASAARSRRSRSSRVSSTWRMARSEAQGEASDTSIGSFHSEAAWSRGSPPLGAGKPCKSTKLYSLPHSLSIFTHLTF